MKKALKMLCLMAAVVMLSGCYRINTNVEIKNDKSGSIEYVIAIDKQAMSSMGNLGDSDDDDSSSSSIDVEQYKELKDSGWKVEEYSDKSSDHDWEGVKLIYEFKNIDDLVGDKKDALAFLNDDKPEIKNFFYKEGDKYVANQVFDNSSSATGMENYKSMFDLKYTVKLPNKAISNNATSVDGTTYTWDLDITKKNEIKYEFKLGGSSNLVLIIGIAAAVVVIGAVAFVLLRKKN